jgi:hypothetical protein
MQTNGDFVLKDANGNILSDVGTSSTKGAYFMAADATRKKQPNGSPLRRSPWGHQSIDRRSTMNVRNILFRVCFLGACGLSACGTAESDITEQNDALISWPVPVGLRLTTIKMNGHSTNPSMQVNVYVTLPGLASTRVYLGDYAPASAPNTNQFNCSKLGKVPGGDGYCTANLPLQSTVGSVKFTGKYPVGSNSQSASVRINGTTTNFTIDGQGNASQTCATTWMLINNLIDGDKVTVCWQTTLAIPYTAPPSIETIFYPAPGEESSVGLEQSNTISTRTSYTYESGQSFSLYFSNGKGAGGLTFQSSTTLAGGQTITSGSSTGFKVDSTTMLPDPNNDLFQIMVGANAAWLNWRDGTQPTATVDLASGHVFALTLGQLRGLAQTPQDLTTIPSGDQSIITQYITPNVAQQFVALDPSASSTPLAQTVANSPKRFIPAAPAQMNFLRRSCPTCGDPSSTLTQVHGSSTDTTVGQTTGASAFISIYAPGVGAFDNTTIATTYIDTNQSTAAITLKTHSLCVEGTVDLYMDKAFGTIVSIPHLMDACEAPTNCSNGQRVLKPGQSLARGQSLKSCDGNWTLTLQSDGMLVERYVDGSIATSFYTPGATIATMQTNGDFVVKDAGGNILTDSGTSSTSGAYLILQDDGFINIYNPGATGGVLPALWSMAPGG